MSYSSIKNGILGSLIFDTEILKNKEESVIIQTDILYMWTGDIKYNDSRDIIVVKPNIEDIVEELNNYFSQDEIEAAIDNGCYHRFEGSIKLASGRIRLMWCE
mgnify:CR=1 FL=1